MSIYTVTYTLTRDIHDAYDWLVADIGREPVRFVPDGSTLTVEFLPDLTGAEQATLQAFWQDLQALDALGIQTLTLADYRARKQDIADIKAYMALASPTQAQTLAAFRALVRVVGAMLRVQIA
jgi:hypothetical protein